MIVEIFKLLINSQLLALGRFFKKHRKIFQSTYLLTKNINEESLFHYKKNTDNFYYSKYKPLLKKPLKNKSKRRNSDS